MYDKAKRKEASLGSSVGRDDECLAISVRAASSRLSNLRRVTPNIAPPDRAGRAYRRADMFNITLMPIFVSLPETQAPCPARPPESTSLVCETAPEYKTGLSLP